MVLIYANLTGIWIDTIQWFPMEYYGNEYEGGVNGHYYHVFYTPLYYAIPESIPSA